MKVVALVLFGLLVCAPLSAKKRFERLVTVFVEADNAVPFPIRLAAQAIAAEVFGKIGIGIDWKIGRPLKKVDGVIALRFVPAPDADCEKDALAVAYPYEGSRIHLFWDRMKEWQQPQEVLGHVMAHEIAHILEGIARHSEQGIMKAHWDLNDRAAIRSRNMRFDDSDIYLIQHGLDFRMAQAGNDVAGR